MLNILKLYYFKMHTLNKLFFNLMTLRELIDTMKSKVVKFEQKIEAKFERKEKVIEIFLKYLY